MIVRIIVNLSTPASFGTQSVATLAGARCTRSTQSPRPGAEARRGRQHRGQHVPRWQATTQRVRQRQATANPTHVELAESFVRRAEVAGFTGIVVTLDTWSLGYRPRDLQHATFPQLRGYCLANYFSDPVFRSKLAAPPEEDPGRSRPGALTFGNPSLTWDDLTWLRGLTELPLLLKGICHPDDVRRAKDAGVDGIHCSNHGGRQAASAPALDLLPAVVDAAEGLPVLFDSGVRSGVDVVKALALGATAVGIGRPYGYGAVLGGTAGVEFVLSCLLARRT
ncbi:MAG: lactate 2-monooxygenase [Nocardioidaceae bacterium]|nr:lactate 2-monooxygenase [Nocardioidaceae bacterium]